MIRISDYVITPSDIAHAFRWRYVLGVGVGAVLAYGLHKIGAGGDIALFVSIVITAIICKIDSRVPFTVAILCFVGIMATSVMTAASSSTQVSFREELAVIAFCCLVVGVILLIREQVTNGHHQKVASRHAPAAPAAATPTHASAVLPTASPATKHVIPAKAGTQSGIAAPAAYSAPTQTNRPVLASKTTFKPHLAPHPALLRQPSPQLKPQAAIPNPLGGRIIRDIMRPAPSLQKTHKPQHPRPKLIQL